MAFLSRYTSTGRLPDAAGIQASVNEAYLAYRSVGRGDVATVYPALTAAPSGLFGICVAASSGALFSAGDVTRAFTIMSIAKPFVFALICDRLGTRHARRRLGVNATGRPFDSVAAVESADRGATNPMVNAGAIATVGLVPGATTAAKWDFIAAGLSAFAGRELRLDQPMYASAAAANQRNRAIALLLASRGALYGDPAETLDLYTRQCCLALTTADLAVMGATLADGGVNPVTGLRVTGAEACRCALAVMATAGMYETSGDWLYDTGVPGKSGISGGIVAVAPGKGAVGTFAPPLDRAGNSVRGQLAVRMLSRRLGLTLFASEPETSDPAMTAGTVSPSPVPAPDEGE
jgi:glutaminase